MFNLSDIISSVLKNPGASFFYTPAIYNNAESFLFPAGKITLSTNQAEDLTEILSQVDNYLGKGAAGYGYITYEAGYQFMEIGNPATEYPLIKFRMYPASDKITRIKSADIIIDVKPPIEPAISNFKINTTKAEYINAITAIKNEIREGNTYQVNFTVGSSFNLMSTISELFVSLLYRQSAEYICIINDESNIVISFSPELFFEVNTATSQITAKPMKGTISRGYSLIDDAQQKICLAESEKDKAENIMIVDLLRNDLSRICEYGSIVPENLHALQRYESLFQMTSTVKGKLQKLSFGEIIKNIFPCGSITGAPKKKTMEIISNLEKSARGIYTGAIGFFLPERWVFNVPIRTINITENRGTIGIGSGIVWDSEPEKEYDEVLLKAIFLNKPTPQFNLIETMLLKDGNIILENEHLTRLEKSASYFLFRFNREDLKDKLSKLKSKFPVGKHRLRLELDKWGTLKSSINPYTPHVDDVNIMISEKSVYSKDPFLYFKTTNRTLYNNEREFAENKGYFEVLFTNEHGDVCEGSISNIICEIEGKLYTPQISSGLLAGCMREYLVHSGLLEETRIKPDDLINSNNIWIINSVFGVKRVKSLTSGTRTLEFANKSQTDISKRLSEVLNILK